MNSRLKMDVGGLPPAAALLKTEGFATWLLLLLVVLVAQLIAEHLSRRLELVFGGALGGDSARPVFGTAPSSPSSPLPKVTYSRAPRRRTAPDFGGSTAPLSQPYTCTHLARGGAAEPSNAMAEDEPQVLKSSAKSHKPVVATANGDMGVDTAVLGPPSGDVDDSDDDADLAELKRVWRRDIRPRFEPEIRSDPILGSDGFRSDRFLARFLNAERNAAGGRRRSQKSDTELVARTAQRLEETARFREEYACTDFHKRGMARRLIMHASNAGACVYFGVTDLRTRAGIPVMIGRVTLMTDDSAPGWKPSDRMLPAQHLRAALFVVERAAHMLLSCGARAKGSYILDVGSYPTEEMARHKGTGRYWDADGAGSVEQPAAVLPHLAQHPTLSGLGVLKEALRLMERQYPETLHRVYFYRPGLAFRLVFNVFRLWVPTTTRERFVLVRPGQEHAHFFAPASAGGCDLERESTPRELGGYGPSLDGDRFLLKACERYDAEATL